MHVIFLILAAIAFGIAAFQTRWPGFPVDMGWVGAFILTLGLLIAAVG